MENHIVHKRVQSYAYFFNQQIFPHFFCKIISFSLPPTAKASRKRHLICWKLVKTHIIYSIRPFGQKKFDPPVTRRIIRRHTPGRKVEHRLMPRFSLACGTINGAARQGKARHEPMFDLSARCVAPYDAPSDRRVEFFLPERANAIYNVRFYQFSTY